MKREEVEAAIAQIDKEAGERGAEVLRMLEDGSGDPAWLEGVIRGMGRARRIVADALAKAETTPDRGTIINEAASAGAALVDATERLDRTPRDKVADYARASAAHVDAVARYARADVALRKVAP